MYDYQSEIIEMEANTVERTCAWALKHELRKREYQRCRERTCLRWPSVVWIYHFGGRSSDQPDYYTEKRELYIVPAVWELWFNKLAAFNEQTNVPSITENFDVVKQGGKTRSGIVMLAQRWNFRKSLSPSNVMAVVDNKVVDNQWNGGCP